MNYSDWEKTVPECIKTDAVWTKPIYRCTLFLSDLCWQDAGKLMKDQRTHDLAGQLYDAVGSIGANLSQGFSFAHSREQVRFFESGVGSARESRHWYYKGRHILGAKLSTHRLNLLAIIMRLMQSLLPESTGDLFHEAPAPYGVNHAAESPGSMIPRDLLEDVPLPE
jgi:four helix bundle protein